MSAEDDLLNSFFAEINSLPTPASSEQPKVEEKTVITTNKFVEYADPIVGKPKIKEPAKPKVEERYIPPQFAEVDPEEKKQERLNKFFQNEVANIKKARPHLRRANGETWVDPTYPVSGHLPLPSFAISTTGTLPISASSWGTWVARLRPKC